MRNIFKIVIATFVKRNEKKKQLGNKSIRCKSEKTPYSMDQKKERFH